MMSHDESDSIGKGDLIILHVCFLGQIEARTYRVLG